MIPRISLNKAFFSALTTRPQRTTHRFEPLRSIFQKNTPSVSSTSSLKHSSIQYPLLKKERESLTHLFRKQREEEKRESSWGQKWFPAAFLLLASPLIMSCQQTEGTKRSDSVLLSSQSGLAWVKECIEKHPEVEYLADKDVQKTEDGKEVKEGSYSQRLYNGEHFVEFERTIVSLDCLRLIIAGDDPSYETFVSAQKENKLSRESFQAMHLLAKKMIENNPFSLSEGEVLERPR